QDPRVPLLFLQKSRSSWRGYSGGPTNPQPVVVGQVQEVLRPPAESELAGELELAAGSGPPAEGGGSAFAEASEAEAAESEELASAEASESEPAEFERGTREPIMRLKSKRQ